MPRKTIHTMPAKSRQAIRKSTSMCTCGAPAKLHVNHMGECAVTECKRWTWDPSPVGVDHGAGIGEGYHGR